MNELHKWDLKENRRLGNEEVTITKAEYSELLDKQRIYYNTAGDTRHCRICGHIKSEGLICFTCDIDSADIEKYSINQLIKIREKYKVK